MLGVQGIILLSVMDDQEYGDSFVGAFFPATYLVGFGYARLVVECWI